MGHQLLNVGINSTTSAITDKKGASIAADSSESSDVKPFSSALDEQVEKQSPVKEKRVDSKQSVTNKGKEPAEKGEQTEAVSAESGKKLPDDANALKGKGEGVEILVESGLQGIDNADETSVADTPVDTGDNKEALESELILDVDSKAELVSADSQLTDSDKNEAVPLVLNASVVDTEKAAKQIKELPEKSRNLVSQPNSQLSATATSDVDDTAGESDTKPVVRSDILHAILKKEPANAKGGAEPAKEFQMTADKQFELALGQRNKHSDSGVTKPDTASLFKPLNERISSPLGSSLISTAGASSLASGANTLAPQAASVGQSVLSMQPAIQSEAWGKVLSSRVIWMAREGVQQAELRLNPANLGPVEVKLHMNNDQASIAFVAAHAATRDALEQALPRLKESFQENGMNLANTDVSDQASEQQSEEQETAANNNINQSLINGDGNSDEQLDQQPAMSQGELEIGVSIFA